MVTAQTKALDNLENFLKNFVEERNLSELKARHEQGEQNGQRRYKQRV